MPLTEHQVKAIATDARIALSDEEVANLTIDLNQILENLQVFGEFDLDTVEPTFHPIAGLSNVMRDDEVVESIPVDVALSNAAQQEDGQFKVPPILGDLAGMGGDR
jgi:aspartyl-tRNA(Asn)/glutamyl-tRNA(Gln) amidotransferase subunit C